MGHSQEGQAAFLHENRGMIKYMHMNIWSYKFKLCKKPSSRVLLKKQNKIKK